MERIFNNLRFNLLLRVNHVIIHWLDSVPFSQRMTLLVVSFGLIVSGFYAIIWSPTTDEIEILKLKNLEIQQEIHLQATQPVELSGMDAGSQDIEESGLSEYTLGALMVSPRLFREEVRIAIDRYGSSLIFWQPDRRELNEPNTISQRFINGRLEGDYHQIAQSLGAILQLPWVLEIVHVRLKRVEGAGEKLPVLVADFQLRCFAISQLQESTHEIMNQNGV